MTFTTLYIIFIVLSIIYRLRQITKSYSVEEKPGRVYEHFSYAIMLMLYLLVTVGSIVEYFYCRYIMQIRHDVNLIISLIGLIMYVGVIPVRAWSLRHLREHVSHDIKINEDHRLIKDGPYQYVRHPLVLCVIIEVIGFTLIPNSYFSTGIALGLFLPFMLYRIGLEEKALIERFGYEYIEYQKGVSMIIPRYRL
ncbi:isoprenylcysteine carboxylmethyltransferase family protein [Candidatus Desantisbacteria bacterium]|nr:isoprenylcysteine carboxylmethyltransferase family protein [Candidatus Desantisbacteria bacterium]